ncbi:MAG: replicative helicase loader/inhibitor [Clostridiales bacterium]|nr:replicative helicase loader/inhibitor [Clostridiales bacterium]
MTELTPAAVATYIIKIKLNFENAYVTSNETERELLIASWYEALHEYPKEICDKAVNNALKKAKFAPRLGDVTEEINNLLNANCPSDEELWAELSSVLGKVYDISRYLKYPQYMIWASRKIAEIYGNLNEELKLFVVNTSELVELAEMSAENLQFERARFFKQIPVLKKHRINKIAAQLFIAESKKTQALPQPKNSDKK